MTYQEMIRAIEKVLTENMQCQHMALFSESARLNEDLYLDSVLILQLILHLELDLGLSVPDGNLSPQDYATVSSLANFLSQVESSTSAATPPATTEEFEDVKVHCFVSCVCESLKRLDIDHRPYYFGVWDAKFTLNDAYQLCYHSEDIRHQEFRDWYQRLYGVAIEPWFDPALSKQANIDRMMALLSKKADSQHLMVMLDMYQLPERENKFNQNPFPHYVMLEKTDDPTQLWMSDPDFRWEGALAAERIFNAIAQPSVAGGYWFDEQASHPALDIDVKAYFDVCFITNTNPLTDTIRTILHAHLEGLSGVALSALGRAAREIRVIAVRKYAYEHGFAYFWRALGLADDDFEAWCDVIEDLIQTYSSIQYQLMKLAETEDLSLVTGIEALLDKQDRTEHQIKRRLYEVYQDWCELNDLPLNAVVEEV